MNMTSKHLLLIGEDYNIYINMHKKISYSWFTLIEIIVALTIFSLIMISVMTVFYLISQMSTRVNLERHMQENVKNALDIISEDIRRWKILWVRDFGLATCLNPNNNHWDYSHILCLSRWSTKIEIGLGEKNETSWWNVVNNIDNCEDIRKQCHIIKKETDWDWYPLTNSMSHITYLNFTFWNTEHPKVMIQLGMRPAILQGMASNIIEWQEIIVQTTISERFIQQR